LDKVEGVVQEEEEKEAKGCDCRITGGGGMKRRWEGWEKEGVGGWW
jgi:hypothetical protein